MASYIVGKDYTEEEKNVAEFEDQQYVLSVQMQKLRYEVERWRVLEQIAIVETKVCAKSLVERQEAMNCCLENVLNEMRAMNIFLEEGEKRKRP